MPGDATIPRMTVYDKIPGWMKAAIGIAVLAIAPAMLLSFWLGGTTGGIVTILAFLTFFVTIYVVGIRKYSGDR